MKDKEIIEEMARDIHRVCTACSGEMFDEYTCDRCQAKLLIKKGYRKLPEDSVVLSKEEYEDYKKHVDNCVEEYHRGQHEAEVYYKNIQIPRERKETAEKIYKKIKDSFLINSKNCYKLKIWIKEQFGVDIYE